jgi:type VI protein secretion system component Hcp
MTTKKTTDRKKLHKATKIERKKPLGNVQLHDFSITKNIDIATPSLPVGTTK